MTMYTGKGERKDYFWIGIPLVIHQASIQLQVLVYDTNVNTEICLEKKP